jgi:hypothetical protein
MRAPFRTASFAPAVGLACAAPPPAATRLPAQAGQRAAAFDADRAWADLVALAEIGPRVMGTEGAARARGYIRGELEKLDLRINEQRVRVKIGKDAEPMHLLNFGAEIVGTSSDILLLVAPYDTRAYESFEFLGVNDGGSGAAVLLEFARVFAADPLPYTTWLVFLEGEASLESGGGPAPRSHLGSVALAQRLRELGAMNQVRLAVVLNRVCDADLRIGRDLRSHRIYREEIWRAAARLDRREAFPSGASFESIDESHIPLSNAGLRRVVAVADTSFGGDEPPGLYAGSKDDDLAHCSAESLATVGMVTLEGVEAISNRLARIDRFVESPLAGVEALQMDQLPRPPEEPATDELAPDAAPPQEEAGSPPTPQTGDASADADAAEGEVEQTTVRPAGPEAPSETP